MTRRTPVVAAIIAVLIAAVLATLTQAGPRAPGRTGSPDPVGTAGPITTDPAVINLPVPRMHDGKPDLTGPWVGGGSDADIEREGGLKPGELPLLPWARELRAKREKATYEEP